MRPFRKVLVANRGEIAARIIRACRARGIGTLAVYSEADQTATHVRLADESVLLGPAPARDSYLRGDRLIAIALEAGADAIHPGYGFLSENAAFAQRVTEAGIAFVGPPAAVLAAVGDKQAARALAKRAGVPVVPGAEADPTDPARAARAAEEVGFPLLVKAAAGGGGKGMRVVRTPADLPDALARAAGEAASAFGDPRLYLERLVEGARHVEVQILADAHDHPLHLGERECSLQRRHQKLIEEAPAAFLPPGLRTRLHDAALAIARAAEYRNAGTVEFLVAPDGAYSFLEVNARLQVEHPVTEMVTGLDLVGLQLEVAAGRPLPLGQADVRIRGHAIEARVCAEDPLSNFAPSCGRVGSVVWPGGPGVRVDTALWAGNEVPIHYDPLLAKVIAWAPDRVEAARRLAAALDEVVVTGVATSAWFLSRLLRSTAFHDGDFHTTTVEALLASGAVVPETDRDLAALAAVLATFERSRHLAAAPATDRTSHPSPWALSGRVGRGLR